MLDAIQRKYATANAWRPFLATTADWLRLCLLHAVGRGHAWLGHASIPLRPVGDRFPVHCRFGTSDCATFREIFIDEEYKVAEAHISGKVGGILDLGANIGCAARWFLRLWPEATVTAVEPDPDNCRMLARNLNATPGGRRHRVVNAFVGGSSRIGHLVSKGPGYENEGALGDAPSGAALSAAVLTGEQILARCPVPTDLVKIDVESSERELFEGDSSWLAGCSWMLIEIHEPLDERWLASRLPAWQVLAVEARRPGARLALLRNTATVPSPGLGRSLR